MAQNDDGSAIPHEWTDKTKVANSDRELQEKLNEGCKIRNIRGEIGSVVETAFEDSTIEVRFSDDDIGPVAISTIKQVKRRRDHSGREAKDTEAAEKVLSEALKDDSMGSDDHNSGTPGDVEKDLRRVVADYITEVDPVEIAGILGNLQYEVEDGNFQRGVKWHDE